MKYKCLIEKCNVLLEGHQVRRHFRSKHNLTDLKRLRLHYQTKVPSDQFKKPIGHFLSDEQLTLASEKQVTQWIDEKDNSAPTSDSNPTPGE